MKDRRRLAETRKFKLVMKFSGLCAFVPKSTGLRMWVLLPNAEKEQVVAPSVPLHKSFVRFAVENLYGVPPDSVGISSRGLWPLAAYDIRINPGGVPSTGERLNIIGFADIARDISAGPGPAPSEQSFAWVAPIELAAAKRGYPGAGRIYNGLASDNPVGPDPVNLSARIHLTEGTLSCSKIGRFNNRRVLWRFRSFEGPEGGGDHQQLLASEITCEIDVVAEFVELAAKLLELQRDLPSLRLSPTAASWASGSPKVEIEILNEEGPRLAFIESADKLTLKVARIQDRIFESFYRLSPFSPPAGEMPMPVAERFVGDSAPAVTNIAAGSPPPPIAVGSPPCSPGRTEPV
jgi:hypothetical protein